MWETKFDPVLNQVYYLNDDGSVSFDLPCEVNTVNSAKSKLSIFNKISTKLAMIRYKPSSCDTLFKKKSKASIKLAVSDRSSESTAYSGGAALAKTTSASYFEEFLNWPSEAANDMRRAYERDEVSSVSSVDSIETFYSELPVDIYDDVSIYGFDKELERRELRLQFIRELY